MSALLHQAGWDNARVEPLAGDASARRYWRLFRDGGTAIHMIDPEGDTALFARLARHLCGIGLSAPRILAEAPGELLIEDLGDGLIARLATDPTTEADLYQLATDALVALHRFPPPKGLPLASPERLATMTDLAFIHYTRAPDLLPRVAEAFVPLLMAHALPADVMVLRDYHAENILFLPDRSGAAQAGLLDFQDALQGHRAYDLVSLLEDARRDVSPDTREACIAHYLAATDLPEAPFRASLCVLGAQRNLRILGVFARLAATRGKPRYIDLIPRVWGHLQTDLAHPALSPIRNLLTDLPPPDANHLERLKASCPTP
ncbi:aminoglycoside phosphotransferase family protein [Maliponia aquimaris]|uniref:Phosphotransferase enzyme family protein n=1 Tax=Maliponia aquimaris TaxID=1673631 RepID=A0A238JPE3_9RHOB|nr:phosphotransferase [Maliponia aquimaris]SMX32548.1 Phosphotransferase enzyme family protein [Maliponia aquimaris]